MSIETVGVGTGFSSFNRSWALPQSNAEGELC